MYKVKFNSFQFYTITKLKFSKHLHIKWFYKRYKLVLLHKILSGMPHFVHLLDLSQLSTVDVGEVEFKDS